MTCNVLSSLLWHFIGLLHHCLSSCLLLLLGRQGHPLDNLNRHLNSFNASSLTSTYFFLYYSHWHVRRRSWRRNCRDRAQFHLRQWHHRCDVGIVAPIIVSDMIVYITSFSICTVMVALAGSLASSLLSHRWTLLRSLSWYVLVSVVCWAHEIWFSAASSSGGDDDFVWPSSLLILWVKFYLGRCSYPVFLPCSSTEILLSTECSKFIWLANDCSPAVFLVVPVVWSWSWQWTVRVS